MLYMAGDRPDIQFQVKELAGKLQNPTEKAWLSLKRLLGNLAMTMDTRVVMRNHEEQLVQEQSKRVDNSANV